MNISQEWVAQILAQSERGLSAAQIRHELSNVHGIKVTKHDLNATILYPGKTQGIYCSRDEKGTPVWTLTRDGAFPNRASPQFTAEIPQIPASTHPGQSSCGTTVYFVDCSSASDALLEMITICAFNPRLHLVVLAHQNYTLPKDVCRSFLSIDMNALLADTGLLATATFLRETEPGTLANLFYHRYLSYCRYTSSPGGHPLSLVLISKSRSIKAAFTMFKDCFLSVPQCQYDNKPSLL